MRRLFVAFWILLTALIASVTGMFAYQAGWAAGLATHLPAGTPAYIYDGPRPDGFGFFGLIPLLVLILLVFALFRAARRRGPWGWGGHGGPGGHWSQGGLESKLQDWHRNAHAEPPQPGAPTAT